MSMKKTYRWIKKHIKNCSKLLIIREMQVKLQSKWPLAKKKKILTMNPGEVVRKENHPISLLGISGMENSVEIP